YTSCALPTRSCFCSCYGSRPALHSFPTRRSSDLGGAAQAARCNVKRRDGRAVQGTGLDPQAEGRRAHRRSRCKTGGAAQAARCRSEEHTSELQSRENLVCRLLLEKKKKKEMQKRT